MVEMLPVITISPEYNISLDPSTGMIGAMMGREVIILSMDGVNAQIDTLEATAEDLYNVLDPTTTSAGSYPGREGVYLTAGKLTNMVYGFIFGLLLSIGLLFLLYMTNPFVQLLLMGGG